MTPPPRERVTERPALDAMSEFHTNVARRKGLGDAYPFLNEFEIELLLVSRSKADRLLAWSLIAKKAGDA